MIGKEIADAISPIVMWLAIVGGVVGVIALWRYWIRRGAKKEERLDVVLDAEKERQEAREEYQHILGRRLARWRRKRLYPEQDTDDPTA
jgi:hypothetical protein